MPFDTLETETKANIPPTATMSYMRPKPRGGGKAKPDVRPSLTIFVPTTICGVSKSERFVLQVGFGRDAGKLRIAGVGKKQDGVTPSQLKHSFRFNFGYVPRLGNEIFDSERCRVTKIDDETFEIDVNAEWFAETSDV